VAWLDNLYFEEKHNQWILDFAEDALQEDLEAWCYMPSGVPLMYEQGVPPKNNCQ
jgi:hypothetical protein